MTNANEEPAFLKALALALALALTACASPRRTFTVYAGPGVDAEALAFAAALWSSAVADVHIGITTHEDEADLPVHVGTLAPHECARETETTTSAYILVNVNGMTDNCREHMALVLAHEIGHYMADREDHLPCGNIMQADAACGWVDEPTRADAAYVEAGE